jgi:hypothetical protein
MKLLLTALFSTIAFTANVQAAQDWFPGQTGQYHLIPDGQDVQKITLVGAPDGSCPSGVGLFAVDEYGHKDTVPFTVASKTVFVLTDAAFMGLTYVNYAGAIPFLNIAQTNAPSAYAKASFPASKLQGGTSEQFAGSGSLNTGAAFAVNSKLCAWLDIYPGTMYGANTIPATLYGVLVHGEVVDNSRTSSWPYFSW